VFLLRWVPVYTSPDQRLGIMSIGFLLQNKDDAIVWRGPKKNGKSIVFSIVRLNFPSLPLPLSFPPNQSYS